VKLARSRRPKIAYSPSYANYTSKTNAVILFIGHGSHSKGRTCTGGIGKGKKTENLNVVDVLSVEEQIK
jgi:hypothetical protein